MKNTKKNLELAENRYLEAEFDYRKAKREYEKEQVIPKLTRLVGKFYRTRNSYSCPEKQSDYWWHYFHVIEIKETTLFGHSFQMDKDGKIEIAYYEPIATVLLTNEIEEIEFYTELRKIQKIIEQL